MENTVCEKCPFVSNGTCKSSSECPNYLESWWTQGGGDGRPKLIKDCAPKRLLLQQQYMQLRMEQMQAALEAARTEYLLLCDQIRAMLEMAQAAKKSEEIKTLESKNEACTLSLPDCSS